MKKLYLLQGVLTFVLYLLGFNLQEEQERLVTIFYEQGYEAGPYGQPTVYFAIAALLTCCFCIIIGMKTANRLQKMGQFWVVTSIGFGLFAIAMISSPRGISLGESLWAWYFYYIGSFGWSYFVFTRIEDAPLILKRYEDDILDDI